MCSEHVDSNEQRATATGQGIMGMLAGCEESVREKWKSLCRHFQGLGHRHLCCRTLEIIIQTAHLQFKRKCLLLMLLLVGQVSSFLNF